MSNPVQPGPICVFSETFDPPHRGHVDVVRWCIDKGAEKVVLVVKPHNKQHTLRSKKSDRIAMITELFKDMQNEFPRRIVISGKNRIDTRKQLRQEYPDRELVKCERWGENKQSSTFKVYDRYWIVLKRKREIPEEYASHTKVEWLKADYTENQSLSSRAFRVRFSHDDTTRNQPICKIVSDQTLDYILDHELYKHQQQDVKPAPKLLKVQLEVFIKKQEEYFKDPNRHITEKEETVFLDWLFQQIIDRASDLPSRDLGQGFWSKQLFKALHCNTQKIPFMIADAWRVWKKQHRYETIADLDDYLNFGLFFYEYGDKALDCSNSEGLWYLREWLQWNQYDELRMARLSREWMKASELKFGDDIDSVDEIVTYCKEVIKKTNDNFKETVEKQVDTYYCLIETNKLAFNGIVREGNFHKYIRSITSLGYGSCGPKFEARREDILQSSLTLLNDLVMKEGIVLGNESFHTAMRLFELTTLDSMVHYWNAIQLLKNPCIPFEPIKKHIEELFGTQKAHVEKMPKFDEGMRILDKLNIPYCQSLKELDPDSTNFLDLIALVLTLKEVPRGKKFRTASKKIFYEPHSLAVLIQAACHVGDFDYAYEALENEYNATRNILCYLIIAPYVKKSEKEWTNYLRILKLTAAASISPDFEVANLIREIAEHFDTLPFSREELLEMSNLVSDPGLKSYLESKVDVRGTLVISM